MLRTTQSQTTFSATQVALHSKLLSWAVTRSVRDLILGSFEACELLVKLKYGYRCLYSSKVFLTISLTVLATSLKKQSPVILNFFCFCLLMKRQTQSGI